MEMRRKWLNELLKGTDRFRGSFRVLRRRVDQYNRFRGILRP